MARIFPFQPYRYTAAAGPLAELVTQPYDKISPAMQARYLALNPHNLVRIILGERFPSDTESENVYTRAAAHFRDWIARGVLAREVEPSVFAYFQEFEVPDSGKRLLRKGFIGLGEVVEYAAGIVHRHEQTLSGPKKDRRQVLEQTRAHFGQIFMLYPDPRCEVDAILDQAAADAPLARLTDEYGTVHTLWKIGDPAAIARIQAVMADKKLLIADGHHRYETALGFRADHPELEDARHVMMTFVNMHSPGLEILATHRVVSGLETLDREGFFARAGAGYRIAKLAGTGELKQRWAQAQPDRIRIGVAIHGEDAVWLLERERGEGGLDVRALHQDLLEGALGISHEAVRDEKFLRYVRGVDAAVEAVRGGAQIAFLLEATTVKQTADTSFGGGVMPQKSTDFYPKLLTGMTIYRLEK